MILGIEIVLNKFNLLQTLLSSNKSPETTRAQYLPFANINARMSALADQMIQNDIWYVVSG